MMKVCTECKMHLLLGHSICILHVHSQPRARCVSERGSKQQRSLAPTLGVGSFRSNRGHTRTSWQTETQKTKSPLNTTQRDTAYTSSCSMCPNHIEGKHGSHDENTHVNCLPTSLFDHFVKQQVLVICLVLG